MQNTCFKSSESIAYFPANKFIFLLILLIQLAHFFTSLLRYPSYLLFDGKWSGQLRGTFREKEAYSS